MVRPRKPTAIKILHGDFKKNPQRRNKYEPEPTGEIITPESLSPLARENWDIVAPILRRMRLLTPLDTYYLAEFCEAVVIVKLARLRVMRAATGQLETPPGASNPMTNYAKAVGVMANFAGKLGLSPADRARLELPTVVEGTSELISGLR